MPQSKKNIYIIAAVALVLIFSLLYFLFIFQKKPKQLVKDSTPTEVKQITEIDIAKRPFVTITPTSPGTEVIITMENMSNFDSIEYELTYQADNPSTPGEKIERGATGTDIDPKADKYKKSILLGTASKGVSSPDKNISDGKLTLHLIKNGVEYLSETKWDMVQAGAKATSIKDSDNKISVDIPSLGKDYYMIIADTVGVPVGGDFDVHKAILPVYGVFTLDVPFSKKAALTLNTTQDASSSQLYSYDHNSNQWTKLDSTANTSSVTSQIGSFGTFVLALTK